jgi:murein DD-endopeptidase MepM/ murein hydrolase activator NlpD
MFAKWGSYLSTYIFLGVIALAVIAGGIWLSRSWFDLTSPEIQLRPEIKQLGASQNLTVHITDANSGLSRVRVSLRQENNEKEIVDKTFPGSRWGRGGGEKAADLPLAVEPRAWGFKDGPAKLIIEARDFSWMGWLRGNRGRIEHPVTIDLTPLRLTFTSINEFLVQGGTGLVTYQVNKPMAKSGILVNGEFYPGFPISKDSGKYLAFFAVPHDLPQPLALELLAVDLGGVEAHTKLLYRLKTKRWKADKINIDDDFLNRKMTEFQEMNPELKQLATPLEVFLRVNQDERHKNAKVIEEICSRSQPEQLWQGAFLRLPRSKPMAAFADHRSYMYKGREIDKQVHLGQDLASLEHAEVPAGNNGIVVFTGPLGIYGKSVILDHGWGLFSLYSHLSRITVEKGQKVAKGAVLGNTGATGMAGGDHLHFSILIQGKFVNPLEWWDPHWIKDQVNRQLATLAPAAAPAKAVAAPAASTKEALPKNKGKKAKKKQSSAQ